MSTFSHLKRNCPVCNGARNDCRRNESTGRVHCRTKLEPAPGWHLVGQDTIGFGIYSDTETEGKFDREVYRHRLQQQKEAELKQLSKALPVERRDKEYRSIARRRGLANRHRQELQQRGLSNDQIDWMHQQGIVWSWSGGQLPSISANLPGAAGKDRLRNFIGLPLAIAAPSINGLIAGCQLRPNEGGYFWASSASKGGYAPKLANGENPIGVYRPMGEPLGQRLWLAEGFAKPQIAAFRLNEVVIGAAGGQFASSPEQVKAAIAAFQSLPITLAPDGGAVANRNVMRAYQGLHELITEQGGELRVAWWGQITKDDGDIDEISDFESIQYISWEQFTEIALEHGGLKPDGKTDYQPTEIYSAEYVAEMSAADATAWELQEQVKAAQFIDQLEAKKKTRYRTEVKPNAAAAAVRMASKEQDDVHHVTNQQEAIQKAAKLGKRVLVNVTMTGGGKNFQDAQLLAGNLAGLGVTKKITVLPDALNPSQDFYTKHYSRLDGRHLGTIVDPLSSKKRRADGETVAAKIEPSNCGFASVRNVNPQLACMVCRHRWHCGQESGDGYGARYQAHEAWRNPNLITSYGRLPHPDSDEAKILSTAFLTLDEARERVEIAKTIEVPRVQIFEKLQQLVNDAPASAAQLKPLLDWLLSQEWKNDTGYNPVYGSPLLSLPIIPTDIDWETLIALESTEAQKQILTGSADKLTPSERNRLQRLEAKQIPNAENERQWRRLEAKLEQADKLNRDDRKALNLYRANYLSQDEDYELANLRERHERTKFKPMSPSELCNKAASLPTPWLVDFLSVAIANQPGLIHFNPDGSFTVTVANDHHRSAIASAKYVMLMGAYEARTNAEIAQRYGCHPNEVFIFDTRPEWQGQPVNLKIVQVASLGKMGRQRGQSFEDARLALNAELERRNPEKHLNYDLKGQTRDKTHFVDNSSDNEPFKQGVTSILMTVPRPNMAAKLAEYNVLTGGMANFEDEGFQRFYQGEIQHLIKQTAGRFRSHRQPEKQFTLYIIAEDELPIEVDEVISAAQITPDAAVKTEVTWHLIDQVMASIAIEGGKLTQAAIAAGIKALDSSQRCSQEWISQLFSAIPGGWKLFKAIFQAVFRSGEQPNIKNISTAIDQHSATYKTEISPEDLDAVHQLFTSIMELYQQGAISAVEVVKEVISIALSLGAKTWRAVSASMPLNLRMSIKEMLFQAFPYEWQRKRLRLE